MKFFKDDDGLVFAFEADGSQDAFVPAGLLPITEEEADALRAPAPESWGEAHQRALAVLKAERTPLMSILDGLQSTAATNGLAALLAGDAATAAAFASSARNIEALKEGLRAAPEAINFPGWATYEQMRYAGKAYYRALVDKALFDGAPDVVVTAFKQVV